MPEDFHEPVIFALKMFVSAFQAYSDDELRTAGYPVPLDVELAWETKITLVSRAAKSGLENYANLFLSYAAI